MFDFPQDQSMSTPTGQWIQQARAVLLKVAPWLAQSGLLPSMGATVTVPANTAVSAQIIERIRNAFTITVAPRLSLPDTIAADNANYITITIAKYNSDYSIRTPLYQLSSQAGLAAGEHDFVQVGAAGALALAAGESLAWDVAKTGTGPATTGGRIDFPTRLRARASRVPTPSAADHLVRGVLLLSDTGRPPSRGRQRWDAVPSPHGQQAQEPSSARGRRRAPGMGAAPSGRAHRGRDDAPGAGLPHRVQAHQGRRSARHRPERPEPLRLPPHPRCAAGHEARGASAHPPVQVEGRPGPAQAARVPRGDHAAPAHPRSQGHVDG